MKYHVQYLCSEATSYLLKHEILILNELVLAVDMMMRVCVGWMEYTVHCNRLPVFATQKQALLPDLDNQQ